MKKITFLIPVFLLLIAACGGIGSNEKQLYDIETCNLESPQALAETVDFSPPIISDEEVGDANSNIGLTKTRSISTSVKTIEKIKKTATIDITVRDYKAARSSIEQIVKSNNAYISGERESNSTYSISNTMFIRVPNKNFDGMVANLPSVASHVNSKNVFLEDVTAEFIDISTRLKTKKEVEKRYLDILKKAIKVTDVLEVEEQLSAIREEIEAKEGQLKYLNDQVDYSTITLEFQQNFEFTPEEAPGFFGRIKQAVGNGWNSFLAFMIRIVYAWPWLIVVGALLYFVTKYFKRKAKK